MYTMHNVSDLNGAQERRDPNAVLYSLEEY